MTRELAESLYRRKLANGLDPSADWFNDPKNWPESNRRLTPAELCYAMKALRDAA